jgi:hypothetical protein
MNRIFLSILSLVICWFSCAFADEDRVDGISASGKIAWHIVKTDDGAEVLISEGDQGESAAQKLSSTVSIGNTKVSISPSDEWIIVQSGGASLGISLTVFQRENGMIYNERPMLDIATAVLKKALENKPETIDQLDHIEARIVAWSADSKSIQVNVQARGGSVKVEPVEAIFDLAKASVTFDLTGFKAAAGRH